MKKRTTTLPFLACLLFVWAATAQNDFPCATDFLHHQALQNPALLKKHQALEQEAYHFFLDRQRLGGGDHANKRGSQVLTVPVVVHIIHNNGPENISDAAAQQAIAWLNEAFSNQGYYDQGSGAEVGIQFCFAQRTPDGLATNGITRNQSTLTEFTAESQQGAMKNINRWKPTDYINIWVVRDICSVTYGCGLVAYAYYPSYHGSNLDGIVIEANYINSVSNVSVLAHEMGHYFGLYHTFEGGCSNNDCLLNGDRVCDTPPDQSTAAVPCDQPVNTCSTDTQSGFATDQPDMLRNHMDYGHIDCKHDFTEGQTDRMNYFLNGTRHSLLDSKGCLPPCPLPTVAAFTPGDTTIDAGQTLFFDNNSQNAVNFSWTLNGIPFGGQQNAAYLFDSVGVFTIQLVAQPLNAQLCEADSAQVTVQVVCEVKADFSVSDVNPDENEPVIITNTSQNATQYEWFVNGVSQGAVLDSMAFDEGGVYVIKLWVSNVFCHDETQMLLTVRDSCKNPGFQFAIHNGSASQFSYWDSGRITVLNDGNAICGGIAEHSMHKRQVFFSKIAGDGNILWSKTVGDSTAHAYVFALQPVVDGGFVATTWINNQTGVMKLSQDGVLVWYRYFSIDSFGYELRGLVCNPDGSIVTCGNRTENDLIVVKFDSDGNLVWNKCYRASPQGYRKYVSLALASDGGYILAGYKNSHGLVMKLDANGAIVWNKTLQNGYINKVKVLTNGTILLAGQIDPNDYSRGWLTKMLQNGELIWSKRITLPSQTKAAFFDLEEGPGEYFTAVGMISEGLSIPFATGKGGIFRFDSTGQFLWAQRCDNVNDFYNNSYFVNIAPAPGGSYFINSIDYTDSAGISQIWLLKTDAAGFTGDCTPKIMIPITTSISVSVYSDTYDSSPPPPLHSDMLPMHDLTLKVDTLCAPECYVSPEICNNNLDDDGDGLFDCLDSDCNCPEDVCKPGQANIWYFGNHSGLDFKTEPPTVLTDGGSANWEFSASTACDAAGNLLFYTDNQRVYNRFHDWMYNGEMTTSPVAGFGGEQISIPHPGTAGHFYIFTSRADGLRYSRVDMQLDNGLGGITPDEKEILLLPDSIPLSLRMTAVKSCFFDGYWLICTELGSNSKFIVYKIDQNGLNLNPVISSNGGSYSVAVQIKVSPDGRRIVVAGHNSVFQICGFDVQTGIAAAPPLYLIIPFNYYPIGFEFSPGGRYLYMSVYKSSPSFQSQLFQYDLEAGDQNEIQNSIKLLATLDANSSAGAFFGAMQLAPNGKIYIANQNTLAVPNPFLHVVHRPDLPAPACQFQKNGLALTGTPGTSGGLVNIVQSLFARPAVAIHSGAPDTICILDSLYTYTADKSGCFSVDSMIWKMDGLSGTLNQDYSYGWIKFDAPGEGNLVVTAYTECGIVADTLHIVVTEPFDKTLDLGPDRTVCDNGVFTFNAGSGFARYRWQNGAPDSVLTTLLPGQYWVDVWDACGTQQSDTVTISITPSTVLDLGDDREGCNDLVATFQRPDFFPHWQWTPSNFISCDTCSSIAVTPASTTSWIVVAQTDEGCISVDTLTFVIRDTLFFQLDTSVCFGQSIELFGMTLRADTTAQFFFPASGSGCDTLLTVNVLGRDAPMSELEAMVCPGMFFNFNGTLLPADTTAVFLFPATGSACDSVVMVYVTAWPPPTVILPPDTTLRVGATLQLKAETTGTEPFSFAWSPAGGLSCTDCPDPGAAPLETTLFTLSITDANGCPAHDSMLITVDPACVVIIPNAFTPNGDGVNDRFYPKTDPCVRMVRAWRVLSRWGEMVFERFGLEPNDPGLGWDGNRANGEPFPSDVLVWYVELEFYDGREEVRKGDVGLLR